MQVNWKNTVFAENLQALIRLSVGFKGILQHHFVNIFTVEIKITSELANYSVPEDVSYSHNGMNYERKLHLKAGGSNLKP